ncbi:Bug family tripartite tricarboxylate transporter substrate binding protein [Deinococcus multiflagellatus]|uniref:Bug family tripartite tricarboxylate transporter substrate binding protein n=1 Tax=Deinococcus multiflagellatus TaxID=1656887 RepID=A0ABW1ZP16_9DEIO|nr:tripartite tricarboxylate transporter substrate binding protein [Deinococcus multiflagellatus]MBZ9715812.1 tripartite tricarboxylate transporter substrate binding protein [Deinococcus multiflagellatus]
MKTILTLTMLSLSATAAAAPFKILAPSTAGGGYDTLARNLAKAFDQTRLAPGSTVYNIPGDGGVVGLRQFTASQRGQGDQLVVFGLTTIASLQLTKDSPVSLKDLTPLARLTNDYEVLLVPATSSIRSLGDLIGAYKTTPGLRFGGASVGSAGHLFTGNVLQAGGGNIRTLKWIPSSGNLQAIKAMLGGELDVVSSSYGVAEPEIQAGRVRALALSAPEPVAGINVPTARSLGIDAELVNWRGVFAPSNLSSEDKARLTSTIGRLARSKEWRTLLTAEKQNSFFQPGISFSYFLDREAPRIQTLLKDLGLLN